MIIGDTKSPGIVHRFASLQGQSADTLVRVETRRVPAGQILLEHLKILTRKGILVMIASDQRLRLELVNQPVGPREMPIGVRLVPHSVEPDAANISVVCQQLA